MQRSMPLALLATLALSSVSRADPLDRSLDLSMKASVGDGQIAVEKKTKGNAGKVNLQDFHFVMKLQTGEGQGVGPKIGLDVTLRGADADAAGLPYLVATLGGDPDPLQAVQQLGYEDVDVVKARGRPCTDVLPDATCVEHAHRLATLIDATLALGSPDERARFREDAAALGFGSDCSQDGPPPCVDEACPEPEPIL